MSLIRFNNSSDIENIEANLSLDSSGRVKICFKTKESIPDETTLLSGFSELNEHNFIQQSDFRNMNYLYQKIDELTYVLTNDNKDIYTRPEISTDHPENVNTEYIPTVNEVRDMKISALSSICNRQIVKGVDIDVDGNTEHFSYTEEDQANIKELFDLAVQTNVPMYYHSDGNSCKLYTIEQIAALYKTAAMNKMHHITYFNQLKMYLGTLNDLDDINSVEYGTELTGEYLNTYNSAMAQAELSMEALL